MTVYNRIGRIVTSSLNDQQRLIIDGMKSNSILTRKYVGNDMLIRVSGKTSLYEYGDGSTMLGWLEGEGYLVSIAYHLLRNGDAYQHFRLSGASLRIKEIESIAT